MNKIINNFYKWVIQWAGLIFTVSIFLLWLYIVKWRNWLTAQNEDILSADKWNELVNKVETNSSLLSTWALTRTNATLENWRVNYDSTTRNTASYTKDNIWNVTIRWLVKSWINNKCIFTLPEWYRPLKRYLFTAHTVSWLWRVDILSNWCVYWDITSTTRTALDWLTFRAEQ